MKSALKTKTFFGAKITLDDKILAIEIPAEFHLLVMSSNSKIG